MEFGLRELPTEKMLQELASHYPEMNVIGILAALRLLRFGAEFEKALDVYLSRHGISLSRFSVLMMLRRSGPEGLKPTELAEKTGVTRGNMTGLIDGLEKSKLIRRQDSPTDRRIVYIKLSPQGRAFLEKILPDHLRRLSQFMTRIGEAELSKLSEDIEKLREGVSVITQE